MQVAPALCLQPPGAGEDQRKARLGKLHHRGEGHPGQVDVVPEDLDELDVMLVLHGVKGMSHLDVELKRLPRLRRALDGEGGHVLLLGA